MAADVTVALITGSVAIAVSLASFPLNYQIGKRARQAQTQDLMARYRDPLLWAVHDLRRRIRTILDEEFLRRYLVGGDEFMRPYARRHTTFVLAQYLGWVEILRRDIGFLDLGDRRSNRKVVELLSIIRRVLFAADLDPVFSVPSGQQRAVGELMIKGEEVTPGRARCIGFAEFSRRLDDEPEFAAWFATIEEGIAEYAHGAEGRSERLAELNVRLSDLIDFLDPDLTRFPLRHEERSRYRSPTPD
jgi:hypothetical protein